jgi:thiamine biosynthesis lipoprotein
VTLLVHTEEVWDTVVSLHLAGPGAEPARDAIVSWLHEVDDLLSTFRPETPLSRWRRGELALEDCPPEVREVLALAAEAERRTGGAFEACWSGGRPDPTGLVKGWAADAAVGRALACGVDGVQVNAGGDVRTAGSPGGGRPWRLGIEAPGLPGQLLDVVEGHELCLATSGIGRRGAHVLRGGVSARGALSVTVAAPDLAHADAYSTAALALGAGATDLLRDLDADGCPSLLVRADAEIIASPGWPGVHQGRANQEVHAS